MTDTALRDLARRAREAGVLSSGAEDFFSRDAGSRPWPVLLLTALGAWLAVVPLLIFVGLLLDGDSVTGFALMGLLAAAPAVAMLRAPRLPLFFEQLAFPLLLTGLFLLSLGVAGGFHAPHFRLALGFASLACLVCAALLPRAWLRTILAAFAAPLLAFAWLGEDASFGGSDESGIDPSWLAWHLVLVPGSVAALWPALRARLQAALDAVAEGWLAATAIALAAVSGRTFLLGASHGSGWAAERFVGSGVPATVSCLLALAGAFLLLRGRPRKEILRHLPHALTALVLAALAPTLGGALLIGALALATSRRRLAIVAGLAALWIVGAFYYQLHWSLTVKGLLLLGLGIALATATFLQREPESAAPGAAAVAAPSARGVLLLASPILLLALAAWAIVGNERILAHGSPLFVELAPVDPRSLMAGDYMALRFTLPEDLPPIGTGLRRPRIALTRDARNVVTAMRVLDNRDAPENGEIALELAPTGSGWTLVTDAWHFREGEAERWSAAHYGEFRALPDGRALLVGLRDAQLRAL